MIEELALIGFGWLLGVFTLLNNDRLKRALGMNTTRYGQMPRGGIRGKGSVDPKKLKPPSSPSGVARLNAGVSINITGDSNTVIAGNHSTTTTNNYNMAPPPPGFSIDNPIQGPGPLNSREHLIPWMTDAETEEAYKQMLARRSLPPSELRREMDEITDQSPYKCRHGEWNEHHCKACVMEKRRAVDAITADLEKKLRSEL